MELLAFSHDKSTYAGRAPLVSLFSISGHNKALDQNYCIRIAGDARAAK